MRGDGRELDNQISSLRDQERIRHGLVVTETKMLPKKGKNSGVEQEF